MFFFTCFRAGIEKYARIEQWNQEAAQYEASPKTDGSLSTRSDSDLLQTPGSSSFDRERSSISASAPGVIEGNIEQSEFPLPQPQSNTATPEVVFKSFRMSMGIAAGELKMERNQKSGRADYIGSVSADLSRFSLQEY